MFIGIFILNLSKHLEEATSGMELKVKKPDDVKITMNSSVSRKHWFQRPSGIVILIFLLVVLGLSFFLPEWMNTNVIDIILMLVRAVIIITLWYFLVAPLLIGIFSKIIAKQKSRHLEEIDNILQLFPVLKETAVLSWNDSKTFRGIKKIKIFIFNLVSYTLYQH